jgi:murein L,D-transpeptidase YafK
MRMTESPSETRRRGHAGSRIGSGTWLLAAAAVLAIGVLVWADVPSRTLPAGTTADFILVEKGKRQLTLFSGGRAVRQYTVSLGGAPVGDKSQEGDQRTPEGTYTIDRRKLDSSFHLALHVSYPDEKHTLAARANGVSPGGDIMIHGMRNRLGWIGRLHRLTDWTAGCIAVTDWEIRQIGAAVPDGTRIEIRP